MVEKGSPGRKAGACFALRFGANIFQPQTAAGSGAFGRTAPIFIRAGRSDRTDTAGITGFAVAAVRYCAYDQQERKCGKLLETAIELAQYIYDYDPNHIFLLNCMQAMKRKRSLNSQEKDKILSIIKIETNNFQEKIGAAILLEDFKQAKILYKKLSRKEQKKFDSFPIVNLWKR